jgi:hypothetical protein
MDGLGFDSLLGQAKMSKMALWPNLPPIQWLLDILSLGHEVHQSPPFDAKVQNMK